MRPARASARRRDGLIWPLALAGLLLAGVGANVAFMVIATRDESFAVEPDYYRKGVAWDATMAQETRNRELGWALSVSAAPAGRPGSLRLIARLTDAGGAALDGAEVAVEALHGAHAAQVIPGRLVSQGAGAYAAELPLRRRGLWELRLRVVRGGDVFTARLSQELPGAP